MINLNSISNSPELPHVITTNPPLKILIDFGASSSIMNPEIAYKLFLKFIFPHEFKIKSVHKTTKGTHALTFPILREYSDDTPITLLIATWHSTYDCLIGHNDLQNLEANINYKTQMFSTSKFERNYFKNILDDHENVKVNHHQGIELQIRTDHMNEEERDKITLLCQKYKDCFYNENKKLSATSAVSHNIRIKNDHPIYVKSFRYPSHLKEEIQTQIRKLLNDEIIQRSNSPYSSPVWIKPKKEDASGKKKWRMVIDYHKLNDKTIEDKYPLPRMDGILENLGKCSYFSTLDLAQDFHQIPVNKDSIEKIAFTVENGYYEYVRMPFG